ncbi:hypothetical protein [Xanthomonas codiaei]|nr:hypothetical protein [Xanthomonas codiaei]
MDALQVLKLIQVPWPADRWTIRPDAQDTPIEGLQWAFTWTTHDPTHLLPAVEEQLQDWASDAELAAHRRALWDELARWETEHFMEQQLLKHRFDARWARDIGFVFASAPGLPIAQWRYCCWAAVRQGASVAQQKYAQDPALIREAIFEELKKRLRYLVSAGPALGMFTPFSCLPESAVARIYVEHIAPMGWDYWTAARPPL